MNSVEYITQLICNPGSINKNVCKFNGGRNSFITSSTTQVTYELPSHKSNTENVLQIYFLKRKGNKTCDRPSEQFSKVKENFQFLQP